MNFEIVTKAWLSKEILVKRVFDFGFALLGLILLSPILAGVAILIVLETPGPALYRQWRVGKNGCLFRLFKFRTMRYEAEDQMDNLLEDVFRGDPNLKLDWEEYQKLWDDPRLTTLGRYLRRYSIDELPQLWNVLKGDMSVVGPRPILLEQTRLYGSSIQKYKELKPGMTGLWQIKGRNLMSFSDRVKWDNVYIDNWSIWLDIYILLVTCWVVVRGEGAY